MKNINFVLVLLLLVVALGLGVYLAKQGEVEGGMMQASAADYQAVFLVNNQVYFGKLYNQNSQFPILKDIFYLQVQQVLQPAPEGQTQQAEPQTVNDISLVKLGGELHGPMDEMKINRDQILLIEDLKADSNVVKAIMEYQKAQAATPPAAAPAAVPAQ